ncbi:MAG: hypothetical protein ACXABM_05545 [Candidatus Thorarchaeota archaeon]|jgi:hypothetical protein
MQIPIDFNVVLLDSGSVIIVVLMISLMIFIAQVREIYSDIGVGTRRALMAYAMSGVAMAIATFVGITESLRFLITGTGAMFLGTIVIAQLWILQTEKRAKQGSIFTVFLIAGVYANNFLEEFMGFPLYFMMVGLSILLLGALYFALVLLRENPSTFSASLLIILILYMATWVIGATYWTFDNPEYYVVQVIPLIVAATVFSSIRRPWRTTLAAFVMLFTFTMGVPLLTNAYSVGSWTIFYFVGVEFFTAFCLIAPLNYFLDQNAETGAKTPLYLGAVVAFVALLVGTHSLSWSIFISNGLVWNQYLVWVDVIIGSCAIIAFMLAVVSSLYGDWALTITREVMIIFATAAALLTFPLTQPAFISNEMVWLALGVVIAIGTLMFTRLSFRIFRAGGRMAAGRLMAFVISALMIALVSMYSDNIPPVPPAVPVSSVLLLFFAGALALLSSPPVWARITITVEKLDEVSDLGVEEDGSIRIEY